LKIQTAFINVILLTLLSACNNPIIVPADVAVTLPPNQDFILRATVPAAPGEAGFTPTPPSAPTIIPPTPTAVPTETPSPVPTRVRKLPYPIGPGEALIDLGFQLITLENAPSLQPVFSSLNVTRRHSTISQDGQKLFLSTSNGTYMFDRAGNMLAYWKKINTADIACTSCMSANSDGSRLALMTRNAGAWEAQVYTVTEGQATLSLSLPIDPVFKGIPNEASIAISPDNTYLALKVGDGPLRVINLQTNLQVLDFTKPFDAISFTPNGSHFVVHAGQELLIYKVDDWITRQNLLLPRENTPFTFSPDGQMVAIALPTLLRVYQLDPLKQTLEINVPPSNASAREWKIAFNDNTSISGIAVQWDTYKTAATIETGQWDLQTGNTLRFDSSTSSAPDTLAALWGSSPVLPVTRNVLEMGVLPYQAFRFISDNTILINTPHSACWLKLLTGETSCFQDAEHVLFASDANTFKEVVADNSSTLVELRSQAPIIAVGPYHFVAVNRTGEWALVDNGTGTDLYTKGKTWLQESVKGNLQGFAENANLLVFTALEKENSFTITVVDKTSGNAVVQKNDNFLYKPVVMTSDGTIYYTQNELDHNQTVFNRIDPVTRQISELTRLSLPAKPTALILSNNGLFFAGLQDGAVMILNNDLSSSTIFQAATSAIDSLAISPDGRFLAVASMEGVQIFSVFPNSR
jgi:WD40 repeat protein